MAKKKSGIKVPTKNELIKKYGNIIVSANNTKESGLWLPSTFFAFNYTTGGGSADVYTSLNPDTWRFIPDVKETRRNDY